MKGLLIKDFKLMKMQRRFFTIICIFALASAFSTDGVSFLIGYLTCMAPLFALTTISYDEFDNGNAFLFSLPITRKLYVIEKYCFSLILGAAALVLSVILAFIIGSVKEVAGLYQTLAASPFIFAGMTVFLSVMLPLQLKFGAEKSRIAILAAVGISVALGYGTVKLLSWRGINVTALLEKLITVNPALLILGAVIITAAILALSVMISISVMKKKEF